MADPVVHFEVLGSDGGGICQAPGAPRVAQLTDPDGNVIGLIRAGSR